MTGRYSLQSSVAKTTRGPHVKSRIPKIKHRTHTIKFIEINWNFLRRLNMTGSYSVQNSVARPIRGPYIKRAVTQ